MEVSLEVRTGPVPEAKTNDKAVNYHVSFDLAIKNDGTDEYNIPSPAGQLWNVVVFQRDSGKVLKLFLRKLSGFRPLSKSTLEWAFDPAKHVSVVLTYTNGYETPKFDHQNKVQTGVAFRY